MTSNEVVDSAPETAHAASERSEASTEVSTQFTFGTNATGDHANDNGRKFRVSVFRAYGIPHQQWRGYTIDHLVPLELGAAPEDLRNV